ncbi:MAG: alkaline phosphatase family protein [Actinomycetota bacterium]|nr:alkaline phosphatase family protein [Actinomycetota bacterium]
MKLKVALAVALLSVLGPLGSGAAGSQTTKASQPTKATASVHKLEPTATAIQHLVVIFQENVSFDHYFATYPNAANPPGEPKFRPNRKTPTVNGLTGALLTANPNSAQPFRLDRSQALTCDMGHDYTAEQLAADAGLMDKFPENTGATGKGCDPSQVMGFFDGNTVTALWNYAKHFAMSDNSFGTVFGPSTPGALNLVSGQTHGATPDTITGEVSNGTVIGDPDPAFDDCSKGDTVSMSGPNIGDLLNAHNVTWGWFQGGFTPTSTTAGVAQCTASHLNIGGKAVTDYSAHHEPFQYYASTSNPHHLPPSSPDMIGHTDQANHQYDLGDFWTAADSQNLPSVSFLKAPKYQDGHAGYSDPLDEQHFLVETINRLQRLPDWGHMAIVIAYDDSDGWYDHVMPPIVNHSSDPAYDALSAPGFCGQIAAGAYQDRCGYGPRVPLLVISPFARRNSVDNSVTDQTSILRFIEDNWGLGRIGDQSFDEKAGTLGGLFKKAANKERLILDPITGQPVVHH